MTDNYDDVALGLNPVAYWPLGKKETAVSGTRLYEANDISRPVPVTEDAVWDQVQGQFLRGRALLTTEVVDPTDNVNDWSGGSDIIGGGSFMLKQLVSYPLDGEQTISGTIQGTAYGKAAAVQTHVSQLVVKVVSNDGTTVRGTLYGPYTGAVSGDLWPNGSGNEAWLEFPKASESNTLTSVVAQDGDRIVIEYGYKTNQDYATVYWYADGATTGDGVIGGTTGTQRAWWEFSQTLNFRKEEVDYADATGNGHDMAAVIVDAVSELEINTMSNGMVGLRTSSHEKNHLAAGYAQAADHADLRPENAPTGFTVAYWAEAEDWQANYVGGMRKADSGSLYSGYALDMRYAASNAAARLMQANEVLALGGTVVLNTPKHYCLVYADADNILRLYEDGVEIATDTDAATDHTALNTTGLPVIVGRNYLYQQAVDTTFAKAAYYDYPLTPNQVAGLASGDSGLILTSNVLDYEITPAPTTGCSLVVIPSPSSYVGSTVDLIATVTPNPGAVGEVRFTGNLAELGVVPLNASGQATLTLPGTLAVGVYDMRAHWRESGW